ncbi:interleukin-1 receptor-associated kinase 3 isoform X2 [Tupaia chinensis]|uniref:interleukin-1 receptor-associated kinase 3 isoform X2 n=1 Tax=Tupaia chinensis TaxID=246437 RepID=UPI00070408D4|nr:interleukin-1 receptor-associated kinase 3 isoform X2 [Tupaia chinensis]
MARWAGAAWTGSCYVVILLPGITAERLSSSWLDVRHIEKYVDQGKSGTRELLWSWAQKNKTIGDLLQILQDMGHHRAIHLITNHGAALNPSEQSHQKDEFPNVLPKKTADVTVDNVIIPEHNKKGIWPKSSISFQNIIDGTRYFHKDFLIGEGEIFEVYRVEFQNRTYAIKLFKQEEKIQCKQQWKRFLSELEILLLFHHPNILELTAYFTETEKFCLVYPYMRNGTLFDRLHCVGDTAPLSWHIRISILIGVSKAVQYLHSTQPCAIICGSISSANILLDDQFQPKLTDFAMAHFRSYQEQQNSTINVTSSSTHLWYMPEEFIRQGKLSVKTDVYSFGIVIMEVLTGCRVVLNEPKHIQLRDLLMELMEKRGLDSCLSFLDKKVHPCPRNFSTKLFSLAGQCVATRAKLRPSMEEVLNTLESSQASLYFAEDPPTSLKSFRCPSPLFLENVPSIPVEDDENQNNYSPPYEKGLRKERMTQKIPFECSQSEVTFLDLDRKTGSKRNESACNVPSSSCEECWSPDNAASSQDVKEYEINLDSSSEAPDHSYRSRPVETSCSSQFSWHEYEQCKKKEVSPEDKEKSKCC